MVMRPMLAETLDEAEIEQYIADDNWVIQRTSSGPTLVSQDTNQLRPTNPELLCKGGMGHGTVTTPDLSDLLRCQLRSSIQLACSRRFGPAIAVPSLRRLVGHVVGLSPEKEMSGILTAGDITRVEHTKSVRDRSVLEFPPEPAGNDTMLTVPEATVTEVERARSPRPTLIRSSNIDLPPVTCNN